MAILKGKYHPPTNNYADTVHFETSADIVKIRDDAGHFTADNVEGALTELFQNVSNGKTAIGTAITDVDSSIIVPTDPTFTQLSNAIKSISTGKKFASGTGTFTGDSRANNLIVRGLDFKPNLVLVKPTAINGVGGLFGEFGADVSNQHFVLSDGRGHMVNQSETSFGKNIIYDDGFAKQGQSNWINAQAAWIAFE